MPLSSPVCDSILDLVGATPLIRLARIPKSGGAEIFVKLEQFNPTGSHKDRIAARILARAEAEGILRKGGTVVEASCGSLAVSLALVCAAKGWRFVAVLPDSVTHEHLDILEAYGASVVLTPASDGMMGAAERAKDVAESSGAFWPNQYENRDNAAAHAWGEGAEILVAARQIGISAFVTALGTGGTLGGVSEALKTEFPAAIVAGILIRGERGGGFDLPLGRPASHIVQSADRMIEITEAAAWQMKERLAREEGLLVGITSGANIVGALQIARELGQGKSVFTLCCDTGERYFSLAGKFQ
jgi:cysteine synthase